jgi:RNA polymerase sigma-70 factor (ECF subfamily)
MLEDEVKDVLLKIALNDDHLSFKKVYFAYYDRLFQLAKAITKNHEVAEEIVDDVFMNIWTKRADLIQIDNLTVYLYVAIKNRSLNHISKASHILTTNIDDATIEFKDIAPGIEDVIITADLARTINQTVQKMPVQCQLVFKLVKEDGLKYREAAEILNISVKTVEYHIGNALKKITQSIASTAKTYLKVADKKYYSN